MDHMIGNPEPSLSVFANCKQSKLEVGRSGNGATNSPILQATEKLGGGPGNKGWNKAMGTHSDDHKVTQAMGHILMITRSPGPWDTF